jgi:hypothetical protein
VFQALYFTPPTQTPQLSKATCIVWLLTGALRIDTFPPLIAGETNGKSPVEQN